MVVSRLEMVRVPRPPIAMETLLSLATTNTIQHPDLSAVLSPRGVPWDRRRALVGVHAVEFVGLPALALLPARQAALDAMLLPRAFQ